MIVLDRLAEAGRPSLVGGRSGDDVAEVYSPPRITKLARELGMDAELSFDLTVPGPDGFVWDFSRREARERALRMIQQKRPLLLILSPPCTAFSTWQNLNRSRHPGYKARYGSVLRAAKAHILFSLRLARMQIDSGL